MSPSSLTKNSSITLITIFHSEKSTRKSTIALAIALDKSKQLSSEEVDAVIEHRAKHDETEPGDDEPS
jgi:hypothetical protein